MSILSAPGERFRLAGIAADGAACGSAALAAALAAEDDATRAAPIAASFTIIYAIARIAASQASSEGDRETTRARMRSRQFLALYAASAGVFLALFPEILPPITLYFFAAMQVPLLALAGDPRVRGAAEWNALLLLGGACAVGGAGAQVCAAGWLLSMTLGLAVRRAESASLDAGARGEDRIGLPLATGAAFGAALAIVFGGAVWLAGAPGSVRAPSWLEAEHPARQAASHGADRLPLHLIARLAIFAVLAVVAFWAAARLLGRFRRSQGARRRGQLAGEMAFEEATALPASPAAQSFPAGSTRGLVVAEYLRYEEALAARGFKRPRERGASAHAGWIGGRVTRALAACVEVARGFASARYGPDEPGRDAPDALRQAALRALAEIGPEPRP